MELGVRRSAGIAETLIADMHRNGFGGWFDLELCCVRIFVVGRDEVRVQEQSLDAGAQCLSLQQ